MSLGDINTSLGNKVVALKLKEGGWFTEDDVLKSHAVNYFQKKTGFFPY